MKQFQRLFGGLWYRMSSGRSNRSRSFVPNVLKGPMNITAHYSYSSAILGLMDLLFCLNVNMIWIVLSMFIWSRASSHGSKRQITSLGAWDNDHQTQHAEVRLALLHVDFFFLLAKLGVLDTLSLSLRIWLSSFICWLPHIHLTRLWVPWNVVPGPCPSRCSQPCLFSRINFP